MQILRPHLRPKKPSGWFRHLRSPGLHIVGVNIRAAGLIHELASVTVASEQIPSQSCGGVIGLSLKGTYFSRCPGPAFENPLNPIHTLQNCLCLFDFVNGSWDPGTFFPGFFALSWQDFGWLLNTVVLSVCLLLRNQPFRPEMKVSSEALSLSRQRPFLTGRSWPWAQQNWLCAILDL